MNDVINEWVQKAEGDYRTAQREIRVQQDPNYDAVCFHAQQCIEKLIKALLISYQVMPGRTHNLIWLSQELAKVNSIWKPSQQDLRTLSHAAVAFRYPGEIAEKIDAKEALEITTRLREQLLLLLRNR